MKVSVLKMKQQIQRGFTLVEIAIVLVIIGLLIGGVLRGQELINAARVNNINNQLSSVQTAYYGFIDRYKAIPGDLTVAQALQVNNSTAPALSSGDGNVLPEDSPAFFNNLSQAGFITCSQCSNNTLITPGTTSTTAATYPAAAGTIAAANSLTNVYSQPLVFVYNTGLDAKYATAVTGSFTAHAITFLDANATSSKPLLTTGTGISSSMLAEIDRKIDEGTPGQGSFRYTDVIGGTVPAAAASGDTSTYAAATVTTTCVNGTGASGTYTWIASPPGSACQGVILF